MKKKQSSMNVATAIRDKVIRDYLLENCGYNREWQKKYIQKIKKDSK
jgi:hypothetical protein